MHSDVTRGNSMVPVTRGLFWGQGWDNLAVDSNKSPAEFLLLLPPNPALNHCSPMNKDSWPKL